MTLLTRDLMANFAGSGWSALLGLAVLPTCLRLMGVEGYGLVGVFATLLSLLTPFEAGLGTALGRDLASPVGRAEDETDAQVVRTLEIIHWGFAGLGGCLVAASSPLIAQHWVKPHALTPATVQAVVLIMGLIVVMQWPASLYSGGLVGLHKQVELNVINAVTGTIRSVGAVLVLMFVSHTVIAYFVWQVAASAVQTGTTAVVLWRHVGGRPQRPYFRWTIVARLRPFLIGMGGTSTVLLLSTQLDKAILSRVLPLAAFGYYTLAGSAASNLLRLVAPVQQAFFPQFVAAAAGADSRRMATLYHRMSQILVVLTAPPALLVVVFAPEAIFVWTGDAVTVARTASVLMLLMFGTLVNALMYPTYTLQIANGWTSLIFTVTLAATTIITPALVVAVYLFGTIGAATVWPALNLSFATILIPLMHRRLLRGEMGRWYRDDVILPTVAATAVVGLARLLLPVGLDRGALFVYLALTGFIALGATAFATEVTRTLTLDLLPVAMRGPKQKARIT